MSLFNRHLPRNDDNKRFDDSSLDRKAARRLVSRQGRATKDDAKAAKADIRGFGKKR